MARAFVKAITPPLVAEYATSQLAPTSPQTDAILTIAPRPCDIMERTASLLHKNTPGMLAQITELLGAAGVNIDNLVNKSRKEYAYTLFDLSGNIPADLAERLEEVPDVIRSRVI